MVATPASRELRIAACAWAWAATPLPRVAASSTTARNCSVVYCGTQPGGAPGVIRPPEAITLRQSAPARRFSLATRRTCGLVVGLAAHVPAVAAGEGDGPGGGDDVRADGPALLDRVAQRQVEEVARAEVAGRGDARGDELAGVLRHPQQQVALALGAASGHRIDLGVEPQVHVRVDQAGQHGVLRQLQDLAALARLARAAARPDGDDPAAVDEDLSVGDHLSPASGEHPCRANDPHALHPATRLKVRRRGS